MKVLIIIPAYNEAENISGTLNDLKEQCPWADYLIINDCSTDGTRQILEKLGVEYLDLPINLGIGGGVQTGYRYAMEHGYDIAIQFDGDGQHMAQYISNLIDPIARGQADVVIGSRFIEKQGFQSSAMRRFGIGFLSKLIYLLSGVNVMDATSGFRAVNRKMIAFYAKNYAQDYPEPEAILAAGCAGARICEVPVEMRDRQGGVSSISPAKSVYYMIKVSLALLLSRAAYGNGVTL